LIRSPSFTLVEAYRAGALTCAHVDLYRLHGPAAVEELGLRDFMIPGCLLLIEWPEKGGQALPVADVELTLKYAQSGRLAWVRAGTALGRDWLHNLRIDTKLASYVPNIT